MPPWSTQNPVKYKAGDFQVREILGHGGSRTYVVEHRSGMPEVWCDRFPEAAEEAKRLSRESN